MTKPSKTIAAPADEKASESAGQTISVNDIKNYQALLKAFSQHYLIAQHPKSIGYLIFKALVLSVSSFSSAWLYVEPSLAYGRREHSQKLGDLEVVCNTIAAALVTFNVARAYINYLEKKSGAKKELKEFVEKTNQFSEKLENALIIGGAIISAAPLTAPAIQYSVNLPLWERILEACLITFDYSLIHTLPMQLLVQTPLLRAIIFFPLALIYYAGKAIYTRCFLTQEEIYFAELREQTRFDHFQLKTALVANLELARTKILAGSFKFDRKKLEFALHIPENVQQAYVYADGLERHLALLDASSNLPAHRGRQLPAWFNRINSGISKFVWGVGAFAIPASISGFMMSTFIEAEKLTHSKDAAYPMAIGPSFITTILVSYFGGKTFRGIYDYSVAWRKGENEIPLPIRLYPKTVGMLIALALFIARYSSGPAEELVYANFSAEKWNGIREALVYFARYGVELYCFINMFEIIFSATIIYAQKNGSKDEILVTELSQKIQEMEQGIFLLDGQKLEDNLKALPLENRKKLLGMEDKKLQEITNHEANLWKKIPALAPKDQSTPFWDKNDRQRQLTQPLLLRTVVVDENITEYRV